MSPNVTINITLDDIRNTNPDLLPMVFAIASGPVEGFSQIGRCVAVRLVEMAPWSTGEQVLNCMNIGLQVLLVSEPEKYAAHLLGLSLRVSNDTDKFGTTGDDGTAVMMAFMGGVAEGLAEVKPDEEWCQEFVREYKQLVV